MSTIHVLPVDDERPHSEVGLTCWCTPEVQTGNAGGLFADPVVIHNSADGREYREMFSNV